jgi:hypothetical protein
MPIYGEGDINNMTQTIEYRNHCKHIAEELERVTNDELYACTECGEWITYEDAKDEEGYAVCITSCGHVLDSDPEPVNVFSWLEGVLDIEYRVGSDKEYRSSRIMVACGGPNIFIDTASSTVELYWWGERATYYIASDVCHTLDEYMEELLYVITHIPKDMVVHRINSDAPKDLLVAPEWNLHKKLVMNGLDKMLKERNLYQGIYFDK